jgi:hypothetical protein
MSFSRHQQIYRSDVLLRPRSEAVSGFAPSFVVSTSLQPAIPRQVGLHQSPPPLHRLDFILNPPAETVNHHPARGGEFSTGEMRNFQPALTGRMEAEKILPPRVIPRSLRASATTDTRLPFPIPPRAGISRAIV